MLSLEQRLPDAIDPGARRPDDRDGVDRVRSILQGMVPDHGALRTVLAWQLAEPGGLTRARLTLAVGGRLGIPAEPAASLAAIVQAVHEASLLLDDISDRSPDRRGRPSAWFRFGADLAMLAGLRLLNSAHRAAIAMASAGHVPVAVADRVAETVEAALDGQATELERQPLSWAEYDWIVTRKTGSLMALPVVLPALAAGAGDPRARSLGDLATRIGLAYQIADDLADGGFPAGTWDGVTPAPRDRFDALLGSIREDLKNSADPLRQELLRLLDMLFG